MNYYKPISYVIAITALCVCVFAAYKQDKFMRKTADQALLIGSFEMGFWRGYCEGYDRRDPQITHDIHFKAFTNIILK